MLIYHYPQCSTSRNVLAAIRASGSEPEVIEYARAGWNAPQLRLLFAAAGLTPRQALRQRAEGAKALEGADDEQILAAMVREPLLVERPFVVSRKGVRLCRPAEVLIEILEQPLPEHFRKENGQPLLPAA